MGRVYLAIHSVLMHVVAALVVLVYIPLSVPVRLFLWAFVKPLRREQLRGKVVLITGASSGIGEARDCLLEVEESWACSGRRTGADGGRWTAPSRQRPSGGGCGRGARGRAADGGVAATRTGAGDEVPLRVPLRASRGEVDSVDEAERRAATDRWTRRARRTAAKKREAADRRTRQGRRAAAERRTRRARRAAVERQTRMPLRPARSPLLLPPGPPPHPHPSRDSLRARWLVDAVDLATGRAERYVERHLVAGSRRPPPAPVRRARSCLRSAVAATPPSAARPRAPRPQPPPLGLRHDAVVRRPPPCAAARRSLLRVSHRRR
uniref:Uncharacterized protein n=1 Tax=Oryza nivara TaxID=4536 RepID=A0A0E0G728_ORYNI